MSSRGAAGATKPKLHNVNSIYAGKNHSVVKAPGLGKHGLQSLGKTTAVVRRMPPPATLPSLRAESQGQDPNVALVPQGGTGWNKAATVENTNLSDSTSTAKTSGAVSGSGANIVGSQGIGQHTTDLRPTWAKPANSMDVNAAAAQNPTSVTASVRDFPSLAAATASSGKQSSVLLNDSLKPQKSGSWRSGGGSAQSRNDSEDVASQQLRSAGSTIFSSTQSRNTERQLPSRYYDGSEAYSPPSGTYQIPKQIPANVMTSAGSHTNSETRYAVQEDVSFRAPQSVTASTPSNNTIVFPTNVAVPPPNYSQPPPNFQSLQNRKTMYATSPPQVTQTSAESGKMKMEEGQEVQQKNGRGDGGYREGTNTVPVTIADNNQQAVPVSGNTDNAERLSHDENDKQSKSHIPSNDRHSRLMGDVDWPSSQYSYMDREAESRRWRSAGGGGQDPDTITSESAQFHYGREYEDDFGRRGDVEREAAIERSRRKRRSANQNSVASESESGTSSVYGSSRGNTGFGNDVYPDWDRGPQTNNFSQFSRESTTYGEKSNDHDQHWGLRYEGNDFDDGKHETKKRDETDVAIQSEYKVLRRPESRESADLSQQVSQVSLQDDIEDEEYELQLTKLAHAPAKVVKRVAPSVGALQQTDSGKTNANQDINISMPQSTFVTVPSQRMQNRSTSDKRKSESSGKRQESFTEASIQRAGDRERKPRTLKEDRSREDSSNSNLKQSNSPAIVAAPLPTDNVWEKRAEEREVAQRAAKKEFIDSTHFPAFNEEAKPEFFTSHSNDGSQSSNFLRKDASRGEPLAHKQRANKHRNQNWAENSYSGSYSHFDSGDFYGQDDEEDSGQLFRGQREFVNSRVSAHHRSRGGLVIGGRDSKGRNTAAGLRRGSGISHQTNIRGRRAQAHHGERTERFSQRRNKRQEEHIPEQEDNFANMGEFRVEDTYPSLASIDEKLSTEEGKKDDTLEVGRKNNGERHGSRTQKGHGQRSQQQQYRATQQYYQPRPQNEDYSGRPGTRGNNRTRGSMRRGEPYVSGNNQNFSERGKRKKEFLNKRDEEHDRIGDDDESVAPIRDEAAKDTKKNLAQQTRFRRNSPTHREGSPIGQSQASLDRISHVKSPVTSEGQEEWETASESSDVAERQKTQKRSVTSAKFSTNRRVRRTTNPQRRENANEGAASRPTHSKNAKPASTTLHAAGRGGQSRNQEIGQVTSSEPRRREGACRDGLAGLDINDAGVVVIDDLRDVGNTSGDLAEDGDDDFEEVISKKNKRIRQQQINEQLEAERRKQKEKEKEKRKIRQQAKKMEKKVAIVKDTKLSAGSSVGRALSESQSNNGITAALQKGSPAMLNTTVWNSSIIKEQGLSPLDNHPVIPSPIARPVHKTGISSTPSSTAINNSKKTVEPWTRPDEEQRQTMSKKLDDAASMKKTTVEFAANFNSPPTRPESQYDFTFDPSLQDDSQPLSPKNSSKNISVSGHHVENSQLKTLTEQNDDERLKERLDKVKDFWPGQQFTSSLLENAVSANSISHLNEKSQSSAAGTGSLHGSNVAKVRPQPQTNDACGGSVPLKDSVSTSSATSVLPPPSPVACIPQGTYLQSLAQVPPPHYSMIFGEPFSLHSAISPPAQAVFNGGVSTSQGPISRSRPASFIEHSHLFVHPPPAGNASSSLTWSNPAPQLEILSGLNPTPSLSSQSRPTSVQRFQGPSGSTFGTPPPVINGAAKLSHIAPPSHSHQVPPPLHPPRNFMPHPPPHEFFPHQGSTLGPVGSQRGTEISNQAATTGGLTRSSVGMIGQVPPPHMQHINFQPQSPSAFGLPGATAFNQVPPMHPFTAPPPLRFPPVQTVGSEVNGVTAATWGKATLPSVSMKFAAGACTPNVVTLERNTGRNLGERWTMPTSLPQQFQNPFMFQQHTFGKEGNEGMQSSGERYSTQCSNETRRETAEERASTASSMSTNGNETVESSKKTAKV